MEARLQQVIESERFGPPTLTLSGMSLQISPGLAVVDKVTMVITKHGQAGLAAVMLQTSLHASKLVDH